MLSKSLLTLALAAIPSSFAQSVVGKAPGFAIGTTGGADGKTVTPGNITEFANYLNSPDTLTIVLKKTFDFTGSMGTVTETGCAPWGTEPQCQLAINANGWCGTNPKAQVTYDVAATKALYVKSNKTIIGVGTAGVIKGKGLYLPQGVSNVIIQNIHITELNAKYVWGGDAIALGGASNIWIDHNKFSHIGRQMIVTHFETNSAVAITNNDFDGRTPYSTSCNGQHYWTLFLSGPSDQITLKGNYIHDTSGRSPKVEHGAVVHAVNNYWSDNAGHAFEGGEGYVLLEGSVFDNVTQLEATYDGQIFVPLQNSTECDADLGRSCAANTLTDSGLAPESDSAALSKFAGLNCAKADADVNNVPYSAGIGKLAAGAGAGEVTPSNSSTNLAVSTATAKLYPAANATTTPGGASSTAAMVILPSTFSTIIAQPSTSVDYVCSAVTVYASSATSA